jgi:hypothetical protein
MQINIILFSFTNMNTKYMVVVAAMAVMLIGTALATEDAFADKKKRGGYEKSQANAQMNYCGNGEMPLNVGCQNTASQIQGDGNEAELASSQELTGEPPI